jgi:hypothetical protein
VKRLPANSVTLIALPLMTAREAEALMDLLEQIQGALWDTYGDAIVHRGTDEQQAHDELLSQPSDDNDDSSLF